MKKSILKVGLVISLSTLFAACSGSSNNGHTHNPNTPEQTPQVVPQSPNGQGKIEAIPQEEKQPQGKNTQPTQPQAEKPENNSKGKEQAKDLPKQDADKQMQQGPKQHAPQSNMTDSNKPSAELKQPRRTPADTTYEGTWEETSCTQQNSCLVHTKSSDQLSINPETISLGKNTDPENNYEFTLLDENRVGIIYYGYRSTESNNNAGKSFELIYGAKTDLQKSPVENNVTANYQKENGFIYTAFNRTDKPKYADIFLNYTNGEAKGKITQNNQGKETLFTISGEGNTVFVKPDTHSQLETTDEATFLISFINSRENNENKYIAGAGKGKNWSGVFVAEKTQDTTPAKPIPAQVPTSK